MKKIVLSLLTISAFIVFACNKDQRAVKNIEGTWKVTSVKSNGILMPDSTFANSTYSFEKCKVKKENCDGTYIADGTSTPFTYNIREKGSEINLIVDFFGTALTINNEIVELTDNKLVIKTGQSGVTTEISMAK